MGRKPRKSLEEPGSGACGPQTPGQLPPAWLHLAGELAAIRMTLDAIAKNCPIAAGAMEAALASKPK